jgi:acetyl-CoA carboxylase carboxyl transferase subunit beta
VWVKCEGCKKTIYQRDFDENLDVCPGCGRHADIDAIRRIATLVDEGSFTETDARLTSTDPLRWTSGKPYAGQLEAARDKTGLAEGVITGRATLAGHPIVLAVMDFRFIGASMGSAVGEKITRAFELALAERRALVIVAASGGARMQEGVLSLMQMAKTAAAAARLSEAKVPYVSILTNPTSGGVTASFAVLADVILAEPGALVMFTGPRVIEQTIRQSLPKGFQTAEFLAEHGFIDEVVDRRELRERISLLLDYLTSGGGR